MTVLGWMRPFLPSPGLVLLLAPISAAYALAAAPLSARLGTRRGIRTPYTRKAFHFCVCTAASVAHLVWGPPGVAIYGTVVSLGAKESGRCRLRASLGATSGCRLRRASAAP